MIWVLLQLELTWQRNNAITFFIDLFFKKLLKRVCTSHNCLNYGKV